MARIVVVGGGLVGSLVALLMARRGHAVDVIERRPDPRSGQVVAGRSINLALSDRGILALERAGIAKDVAQVSIPMTHRTMHAVDGALTTLPYGLNGQAIRSVSRGGLNQTLIELCQKEASLRVHFSSRCVGADLKNTTITVENTQGERHTLTADAVLATDGAYSAVRAEFLKKDRFDYSQTYLPHGYKELVILPKPGEGDERFALDKNTLHIWPRKSFMLIALPNLDGSFTCTLFLALDKSEREASFADLPDVASARRFFEEHFADALALMPTFDSDWANNPTSSLMTVRCAPWHANRTVLIGDAAHAVVPFFGQGMNAGFEDCRVLMELLDQHKVDKKEDFESTFAALTQARKENADAIATLALENFVEMREKVASPAFLLRKKVEAHLARLCPERVVPAYTMVTFSPHLPYKEALARSRAQEAVLDHALALPGIEQALSTGVLDDQLRTLVHHRA